MLALIPYIPPPVFNIFQIPLDSWSLLVSLGFIIGVEFARARGKQLAIPVADVVDGALFIVGMGFVVGHWIHVGVYNPYMIDTYGWVVFLQIWAGFSSNGGFLGAIIGTIIWFNWIRPRKPFWKYADTMAYSLPFGWFFGRLGCFSAHDHVGQRSDFWLAVDFPEWYYGGPRHDLGLYEAMWVFVLASIYFAIRKQNIRHGTYAMLFCFLYAPARFGLDFLRNTDLAGADKRIVGLTPAQYGSILLFLGGIYLWRTSKHRACYFDAVAEDIGDQPSTVQ
jgi:phosphatidylglycerol:prolipoprotein diacylglycerol transferase